MCKINLWKIIPPCFQSQSFFNKICKNQPNQSFDFIFSHFHWFYWIPRVFSSENTPTRYFTTFVPLKSQANFKTSPKLSKLLINDVIPEVVIIFRLQNLSFGFSDHFYITIGLTSFSSGSILFDLSQFLCGGMTL